MTRTSEAQKLARLLNYQAAALTDHGQDVGIIRLAARRLVEQAAQLDLATVDVDGDATTCQGCGGPVVQPDTGRRRKWCSERCRDRARRR